MNKQSPLKLILFGWTVFLCFNVTELQAKRLKQIIINDHIFNVEIAETADELRTGLMFRNNLAPDAGMLFVHNPPRRISMWMKNTEIDLDMLFINDKNKIIAIRTAKAHDLSVIYAPSPVKYVLEINANTAQKLNIKLGDSLQINY